MRKGKAARDHPPSPASDQVRPGPTMDVPVAAAACGEAGADDVLCARDQIAVDGHEGQHWYRREPARIPAVNLAKFQIGRRRPHRRFGYDEISVKGARAGCADGPGTKA